ncbi:prepilin peptidase [Mesorhizobium sp. RP14(2022)]|uniref:Protein translocase subunit SecA n=1 Tax=Mesorhizobium liriopis TaxID=2953882 RepID=A0ABT1C472_9HYPH|nr:DEAD/DEAH box helicase [Mesorhizobium liriopis]MCO6049629.1 prepilin peptidase [Mesorhizobium liriopis]
MSDFALRAPVPVLYGERPQKPKKPLDEQAARLFSPLKLLGAELRAKRLARIVPRVEALNEEMRTLSDEALRARARKIGQTLRRDGDFSMDTVAPAFAVTREISGRLSGRRHYGVQMIGAYAMLRGNLAQMATGEGKTLTAALAAATAALAGVPIHVVTVNDYLAKRDAELTEPIYRFLGFSVGVVVSGQKTEERQAAYACDITYCTNKELTFDYLRDRIVLGQRGSNLQLKLEATEREKARTSELRLRGLHFAIVDEADSVLVDEARTPLVISREEKGQVSAETATQALMLAADLVEGTDYHLNAEQRRVQLTAQGRDRVEEFARDRGAEWRGVVVREELARQALSALLLFHKGEQYLVRENKVQIVDEHTGRVMPDRAWSDGLHQIIEVKEGCKPSARRETIARMTYQRFFRRYRRLAGMTGTGRHVAAEFWSVYRLPVVQVPTHRPRQRIDLVDRVLLNDETKWRLVIERVAALNAKGVPILLGTRSVASALTASERLTAVGLDHEIVSAAQDSTEAAVVARAGERGAITVATNMAGRGTDIHVADEIEVLGGLHVIMVERHEARRIDDQLAGRSGRQGQKGCFQAILSLDDPILDFALSQSMRKLCRLAPARLGEMPARLLLRHAQKRAERIHARMRRDLLKSDENQIKTLAFTGRAE